MKLKRLFRWIIVLNIMGIIVVFFMFIQSKGNSADSHQKQPDSTLTAPKIHPVPNSESSKYENFTQYDQSFDIYKKLNEISQLSEYERTAKEANLTGLYESAVYKHDMYQ